MLVEEMGGGKGGGLITRITRSGKEKRQSRLPRPLRNIPPSFAAQSRALNTPCVVFDYWDTHSVWHGLSALGLFLTGVLVYAIDFDLRGVDRAHISVF